MVLILVLMDNQVTASCGNRQGGLFVLILVLMDNQVTVQCPFPHRRHRGLNPCFNG